MTNKEFYKDKIIDIALNGHQIGVNNKTLDPRACSDLKCSDCVGCTQIYEWGNKESVEYEEKLRADERRKCGDELLKVINEKPYGNEKNNLWLISQINHICFDITRMCDVQEDNE